MKKLILICGANGIGKSTAAAALLKKLPNSAYIDSDYCRMMNINVFGDEIIELNRKNIYDLMYNYFSCSQINNVIFPYGFHGHRKKLFDDLIMELSQDICFEIIFVLLVCDEYENIQRMKSDGRDEKRIARGVMNTRSIYDSYDYPEIDVTNLTIEETSLMIVKILE